ncbi:unnamed protein product [Linum trigynum]|uniref:MtN19-like protein n=1 Tax=Linum trigynum TaxID=586398 RepID=A0AAV2C828_9ROSI
MGHQFTRAHLLLVLIIASAVASRAHKLKSATFLSPELVLAPGSVTNTFHYNVGFPTGHIGLKSFHVEPVDSGRPIPLYDTYLHHWAINRYVIPKGGSKSSSSSSDGESAKFVRNDGICQGNILGQHYGSGSETRRTATFLPDPYAIEIGNPEEGFEERWMLGIHAIDTRGVVDGQGCMECLCELYNVTIGGGYHGGLKCCEDGDQCRVKLGFQGRKRSVYLRYTVKWVDWVDGEFLPVKVFIADVTDTGERDMTETTGCQVEYEVEPCSNGDDDWCVDVKRLNFTLPASGYVVYGVGHQHSGALGQAVYRQNGEVICKSVPIYGTGHEAGNEAGFVVGMSTCYPEPGSVKVTAGEKLILETNYSSSGARGHFGVMGLFHIFIADQLPQPPKPTMATTFFHRSISAAHVFGGFSAESWTILAVSGLAALLVGVVGFSIWLNKQRGTEDGYQVIMAIGMSLV